MSEYTTLILFSVFCLKHFVVDFPLQTKYQYSNKHIWGHPGGILHAALHGIFTFPILIGMTYINWQMSIVLAILEGIVHYIIDYCKVNINLYYNWKPNTSEQFWWVLGLDQLLHYLTYCTIIWYVMLH